MYLHIKIIRKKKFDRNSQNTLFGRIESIINTKIIRQIKNCNKKKNVFGKRPTGRVYLNIDIHTELCLFVLVGARAQAIRYELQL